MKLFFFLKPLVCGALLKPPQEPHTRTPHVPSLSEVLACEHGAVGESHRCPPRAGGSQHPGCRVISTSGSISSSTWE